MTQKQINQILQAKNIPTLNAMMQTISQHDAVLKYILQTIDKPSLLQSLKAKYKKLKNRVCNMPGKDKTL